MISSAFKIGLTIIIFFALVAYHGTNLMLPAQLSSDWYSIVKLVQIASTVAGCYVILNTQWFTWLILKILQCRHFGGEYDGSSEKVGVSQSGPIDYSIVPIANASPYTVKFSIKHSFLEMTITGKSYDESGKLVSSWHGTMFVANGDTHTFAIQLRGAYGEFGVINLTYDGDNVHGVYWSGDQVNPGIFRLKAKRVS